MGGGPDAWTSGGLWTAVCFKAMPYAGDGQLPRVVGPSPKLFKYSLQLAAGSGCRAMCRSTEVLSQFSAVQNSAQLPVVWLAGRGGSCDAFLHTLSMCRACARSKRTCQVNMRFSLDTPRCNELFCGRLSCEVSMRRRCQPW